MSRRSLAVLTLVAAAAVARSGPALSQRVYEPRPQTMSTADSARSGAPATRAAATVPVVASTFGYEGIDGVQGVLSLGLLTSQYAVELNGTLILDWRIKSTETTVPLPPGQPRLRVMIRTALGRTPQILYDKPVEVVSGSDNKIRINFLTEVVSVNGRDDTFVEKRR